MSAIHAANLKLKVNELPLPTRVVKKAKTKQKAKVIRLPLPKRKNRLVGLSDAKKEQLVVEYRAKARKLGRSILRKWRARLDLEEVDSIVDLSLCEAVRRYNPRKGASFMTFLYYHLRGNLIRAVATAASANAIPFSDCGSAVYQRPASERHNANEHIPNAIEIAEALCSHETLLPDEMLLRKELADLSYKACEKLDALEREVIFRVYLEEQQLMDIARLLGYSRCHISRVKKKALETLHHELKSIRPADNVAAAAADDGREMGQSPRRPVSRRGIGRRRVQIVARETVPLQRAACA